MTCICQTIPLKFRATMTDANEKVVFTFHTQCAEHGVGPLTTFPMQGNVKSNWVTKQEAINQRDFYLKKDDLKIVKRSPDGQQALLEWIEWVPIEDRKAA